jgi:hypothetical protein
VRNYDPSSTSDPMTTRDRRPTARVRAWAWIAALVVLMVLTSLAVASVTPWLVLPYLALMALILLTPSGRGERAADHAAESDSGPGSGAKTADDRAGAEVEDEVSDRMSADPAAVTELVVEPAETSVPNSESRAAKARRGKGRVRKLKAVVESPAATATWIQVGPGKFVRVETPGPQVATASPTSEGEPSDAPAPSSGMGEGPTDAAPPPERDAVAAWVAEASFASEGEPEAQSVRTPDESPVDRATGLGVGSDPGPIPEPEYAATSADVHDVTLESHFEALSSEGEPVDLCAPSSATDVESRDATVPDAESEAVPAAEDPSLSGSGSEAWADTAPDEKADDESVPAHDEGNLARVPAPDVAAGSWEAAGVPLESHHDAPPFHGAPVDFAASLSGVGEGSSDALSPGDETEAVSMAEGASATGGGSEVGDGAASGDPTVDPPASTSVGGDPGYAWEPDPAAESAGVVVLGSHPEASLSAMVGCGAGEVEVAQGEGDQTLADVGDGAVAVEFPSATRETDAALENGPSGDGARDNGLAPDAFGLVQPTEFEDAPPTDREEDVTASTTSSGRPTRPNVGMLLASLRGHRLRVDFATRSRPGAPSPGRVVRSGRRDRVSPDLRRPSPRRVVRPRHACRTFPPRSPPALAGRF